MDAFFLHRFRRLGVVLLAAAAVAASAEEPLWFVRVSASDRFGNDAFHSFVPPEGRPGAAAAGSGSTVWLPVRRAAWTKTVAGFVSVPPGSVALVAGDGTFPFRSDGDEGGLLSAGMRGVSVVRGRDGSVRTNEVEVAETGLLARPADRVSGLFPLRGAGREIWFVSSSDLEDRWKSADAASVRHELSLLESRWKDDPSADGAVRSAWLRGWRKDHPAVWPKLVFDNRTGTNVTVRFGNESVDLKPDGKWPVSFDREPDGKTLENWTYLESGQNEEDLQPCEKIDWTPSRTDDKRVLLGKRKFKTGNPEIDIRDLFPDSFDPERAGLRPSDVVAEIRYVGDPDFRPLEPVGEWLRRVEPRREIDSVRIGENGFFAEEKKLFAEKDRYPFGPGRVKLLRRRDGSRIPATLVYKPWPAVVVTNTLDDRTITVEAAFDPTGGKRNVPSFELEAGSPVRRIGSPDSAFAPDKSRIEVRFRTTAERADAAEETLSLVRGGPDASFGPVPKNVRAFETNPYPPPDDRLKVGANIAGVLRSIEMSRRLGGPSKNPASLFEGADGETIRKMPAHRAECRKVTCPDCPDLRNRLARIGCPDGKDPDSVDAALVCALEYFERTKRLSGEKLEAELDKAKALLEPFRSGGKEAFP